MSLKTLRLARRVTVLKLAEGKTPFSAPALLDLAKKTAVGTVVQSGSQILRANGTVAYAIGQHSPRPVFSTDPALREKRYSFAFLFAREDLLVVFVAGGASLREAALSGRYVRVESEQVARLLDGAANDKVRAIELANMSIAPNAVHQRSYRGEDIEGAMPSASQNRHIPSRVETSFGTSGRRATNLATGHVTESGGHVDVTAFVTWATSTIDRLRNASVVPIPLLGRYAQNVRFSELGKLGVVPTGCLLDLSWLREQVEEEGWTAVRKQKDGSELDVTSGELAELLEKLSHSAVLKADPTKAKTFRLEFISTIALQKADVPDLRINKRSIGLIGSVVRLRLVTPNGDETTLGEQIRTRPSTLFVTMSSPEYAYTQGRLFVDRRFKAMVPQLRSMFFVEASLAHCVDEKGAKSGVMVGKARTFEADTVFRLIEDKVSDLSSLLVCSDMGDEWADFVEVGTDASAPFVAFYHAKHKDKDSLGASNLHEVVAQALKNLGRVNLTEGDLVSKRTSWTKNWKDGDVPLLRRGKSADFLADELIRVSGHSQATKRICLVASVLSYASLDDLLTRASNGAKLDAYEVQLIHLLISFSSACAEVSAQARVYVKP